MRHPYTMNQFKVLRAAFRGCATKANIENAGARTRALNEMVKERLVQRAVEGCTLTHEGLIAYVDMCERRDADSGCLAYALNAEEARKALAAYETNDA